MEIFLPRIVSGYSIHWKQLLIKYFDSTLLLHQIINVYITDTIFIFVFAIIIMDDV